MTPLPKLRLSKTKKPVADGPWQGALLTARYGGKNSNGSTVSNANGMRGRRSFPKQRFLREINKSTKVRNRPTHGGTLYRTSSLLPLIFAVLLQSLVCRAIAAAELKGALLAPEQVSEERLASLKAEAYTAVAISLTESNPADQISAATQI